MIRLFAAVLAISSLAGCFARTAAEDPLPGPVQTAAVYGMEETGARRCTASVLIGGRPSAAVHWFTDHALVERWLAERAEVPDAVGGAVSLSWPSDPGAGVITGKLVERAGDKALHYELEPFGVTGPTTLLVRFEPEAGRTRVIIDQGPFGVGMEGERLADAHRAAWVDALEVLRSAHDRKLPTTPAQPPRAPPPAPASAPSTPGTSYPSK